MAQIELAPEVIDDVDRIIDHLLRHDVADAADRIQDIISALNVLERNPLIGRPADEGRRALVIGRKAAGYLALYMFAAEIDTVFVLTVRPQREAGYAR